MSDLRPVCWINIENASGVAYGDGPIVTAKNWQTTARLDRAGTFSFEMPASDPRAALLVAKRRARCFALVGGSLTEIGAGIIDKIETKFEADGLTLMVSGDDLLRELTQTSVGFLQLTDGAGGGSATVLADIIAFASGWSLSGYTSTGTTPYGQFAGETVLAALSKVADQTGQHFRLGSGRAVAWLRDDQTSTGLRAIRPDGDPVAIEDNAAVCLIQNLSKSENSYGLITRIYPFGSGNGQARLTLEFATRTPATGYTLASDSKGWYIANTAAEVAYGRIETYLSYKEIGPVSNSAADFESASNALYDQAFEHLSRQISPQQAYDLAVIKLDSIVYPGQTIRVIWREVIDSYVVADIDTNLVILETTTKIDDTGLRTVALKVSTVDQWPESDAEMIAGAMEQAQLMDAHPQIFGGYYPFNFKQMNLDSADTTAKTDRQILPFDNRQTRLISAKMRIVTSVFESTSKGAASGGGSTATSASGGGSTATSASGGGSTATSSSGGSSTPTTASGPHIHYLTIKPYSSGGNVMYYTGGTDYIRSGSTDAVVETTIDPGGGHSHSVTISGHTHNVTIPSHTHDVTIPAHTHDVTIPAHTHDPIYGVYRDTLYPGQLTIKINTVDVTATLFGTSTIGTSSAALDEEVEIANILNAAGGGFRRDHTIEITASTGRGRVFVDFLCFVQVQAILLS